MRESFNFISLQIYHVRICARSAIDICTNCGCISGRPLRNSSQFFQRLMDEKKEKKGKRTQTILVHPLFLIYVLRIEGKPEFHFHDSISAHATCWWTFLLFSSPRIRSFSAHGIFNFDRSAGTIGNNLVSYLYYVLKLKTFENF